MQKVGDCLAPDDMSLVDVSASKSLNEGAVISFPNPGKPQCRILLGHVPEHCNINSFGNLGSFCNRVESGDRERDLDAHMVETSTVMPLVFKVVDKLGSRSVGN